MMRLRTSHMQDVPELKELWKLAFGDEDEYIDHFFRSYYAPERMLILEEGGVVKAMTAWFDMPLVDAGGDLFSSAYLYAVATHPDCRGRGLAGRLLAFADEWLREHGFACVTTVPASSELHRFFGRNGFEEQFALSREAYSPQNDVKKITLTEIDAEEYNALRETILAGMSHVAYGASALDYQAGVCALSGGGLYRVGEIGCTCVERAGEQVFVKELLVPTGEREAALAAIARRHYAKDYQVRTPYAGQGEKWEFAMLKWLVPQPEWSGQENAYLGLAFD